MTPGAKALIDEIRPYKGGNDLLCRLHDLNNIDKHRLLRTLPFVIEIGNDKQRIQETLQGLVTSHEPIFAGADKVIRLGDGVQFSTDIAFSEEIVAGQPLLLLNTLRKMADMVDEIILEFEPFE